MLHRSHRRLASTLRHLTHRTHTTTYNTTAITQLRIMTTASKTTTDGEVLSKIYPVSGLGHIHLNRPKALNSLNINMVEEASALTLCQCAHFVYNSL
jgi:hypothetical protein